MADGLTALEQRYREHAPELLGAGEDLLLAALAEPGGGPDPVALRQALGPRLRPLLDAAAELDELAVSRAPSGRLGGERAGSPDGPASDGGAAWPRVPSAHAVRIALDLPAETALRVEDASVARLTITRVLVTASEPVEWTPGEAPPLAAYDGDVRDMVGQDHGWTDARWEGVREGTVERVACSGCEGSGRTRCVRCAGSGVEPCVEFERCSICHGTGKRPRAGRELLRGPCVVCNGRGSVPCPICGGQGRRPCQACAGGTVACARCHAAGRVTRYQHGIVERKAEITVRLDADALRRLGRGADRFFRPLARLAADRAVPGVPEAVGRQVTAALEPASPDQVRQRVQVDVLPAVEVTYPHRGQPRTLYLLGEDADLRERKVVRPGGRKLPPRSRT